MLTTLPIIGFIPTTDYDAAKRFYVDMLKLTFVAQDPFAMVVRTETNTIRIVKLEEVTPTDFTILGWATPDIVQTVRDMTAAGVKIERYEFIEHDELGIWTAPDRDARIAWFKDPDGNILSVSQHAST